MTTEKQLVRKLSEVMNEVKYIQKKGHNKFHNYKYATESDVSEKVREELAKRFVMMIPSVVHQETREHTNQKGNREYIVSVMMEFTFHDGETGESVTFTMGGQGQDAGDKAIYKAMTGAQKYALMKAFMIPTGDDPEADEGVDERNHGAQPAQQQSQPQQNSNNTGGNLASEKQIKAIHAIAAEVAKIYGNTADEVKTTLKNNIGAESLDSITKQQASKAIELLNKWKADAQAS